jgi:hypothetical protein
MFNFVSTRNTQHESNTMTSHSSIVGGSTADRLLNCPGSFQAIRALPPSADRPSEYAEEGTAMHEVMTHLMRARQLNPNTNLFELVENSIGQFFYDRELTQEHVDTMIVPALTAMMDLEAEYLDGFEVLAVEKSVKFPGIPGAFGTCDLILSNQTHVLHVDWKFGQGIPVQAIYPDPAGDIVNPQILFYITAAMSSARHFYKGRKQLVGAIVQPRGDTPLSHTKISRKEIRYFTEDLQNAVVKAMERDPPLKKGEHCRWCPAKISCPLWTTPMLRLADYSEYPTERTEMVSDAPTVYGNYLANVKEFVDMLTLYKKEIDEQLHAYLEDGGKVPGWRLKQKVKQRVWADQELVLNWLEDHGFSEVDIWQQKLQTFAHTDAAAKRLGVKIPDHLRVTPPTNETTVCRTDDPAPMVVKPLAIEQFRAALKQLTTAKSPAAVRR